MCGETIWRCEGVLRASICRFVFTKRVDHVVLFRNNVFSFVCSAFDHFLGFYTLKHFGEGQFLFLRLICGSAQCLNYLLSSCRYEFYDDLINLDIFILNKFQIL